MQRWIWNMAAQGSFLVGKYSEESSHVFQVYHARGGKEGDEKPKIRVTFSENTVKAAKELVALKQQQNQAHGAKVTLEQLETEILDMKRDASQIKSKLNHLDDNVKTILEIMASRQPVVERI